MTTPADNLFKRYIRLANPDSMGHLYDRVAPEMLTLALHLTRNAAQAEDLVQEVFLQAMEQQHDWDANIPVESWLSHMLAAKFEQGRKTSRKSTRLVDLNERECLSEQHDPQADAQQAEISEQLASALACLPETYRTVIRLLVQEGMSSEEVGETLQRSGATVRSQLARGLDRLRRILPAAMGLAIWDSNSHMGHVCPTATTTLAAMKQRFLHRIPASPTSAASPTGLRWHLAAKLAGLTALVSVASLMLLKSLHARPGDAGPDGTANRVVHAQTNMTPVSVESSEVVEPKATQTRTALGAGHRSRVFGTVVDELGGPLPGAEVRIYYWEPWAEENGGTEFDDPQGFGWSVVTDTLGNYSIEVPYPPPGPPAVQVSGGEARVRTTSVFWAGRSRLKPLRPGDNQLPPLRLASAGGLSGTVLQHDGSPAEHVTVQLFPGEDRLGSTPHYTSNDGSFQIAHVPAGSHNLRISLKGAVLQSTVQVQAGANTTVPAFTFPARTQLRVQVVDEQGRGIEGAKLKFIPLNESQKLHYAEQETDASGFAVVQTPTADQHALAVLASGFRSEHATYATAPGKEPLQVRLLPASPVAIGALDRHTGKAFSRFSLRLENSAGQYWSQPERWRYYRPNEDGSRSIAFVSGARCRVSKFGYFDSFVEFNDKSISSYEVFLQPLPNFQGRVLHAGAPMPDLAVQIVVGECPGVVSNDPKVLRASFTDYSDEVIWSRTDAQGRFHFKPLGDPELWYCLRAHDGNNHAVEHWFTVADLDEDALHLDQLTLQTAGSLHGQVLVPEDVSPAGLTFLIDLPTGVQASTTDAKGQFVIENIVPGIHYIRMQDAVGLSALPADTSYTIEADMRLEKVLDLRPLATCLRHLRLTKNGTALAGYEVFLRTDDYTFDSAAWAHTRLGVTDSTGQVTGQTATGGLAAVWIRSPSDHIPRKHNTAAVPLNHATLPVIEVRF